MSKAVIVSTPALDASIGKVRDWHGIALKAATMSAAAAIMAGFELRAIQQELAKSPLEWTFEDFLASNRKQLGFGRSTAFKYLAISAKVKQKLLKNPAVGDALALAPSALKAQQARALMDAVHKSIDGESLQELYLDYGIVKKKRKLPVNENLDGKKGPGDSPELVAEDMVWNPANSLVEWFFKKIKVGASAIPLWQHLPRAKQETLAQQFDEMARTVREALKK